MDWHSFYIGLVFGMWVLPTLIAAVWGVMVVVNAVDRKWFQ